MGDTMNIEKLAREAISEDRIFANDEWEVSLKRWEKYGKDRTYVDIIRYKLSGAVSKAIKCGYVDNTTGEYVVGRGEYDVVERYIH